MSAPDRGQILFDGVDVNLPRRRQRNALRSKVQMVLQDSGAAFNPFWRVGSALRAPLKIIRHANPAHRVQEVLEAVGLPLSVMHQFPQELSGGQRQRLNIARALTIAPELLIADEPTSALDVSVQARIIELLADLNTQHHLSMVVITHNLATIPYMTRKVVIMYLGRIVECGASDDVLYAPRHPYTRLLIDSLPGRRGGSAALTMGDVPSPVHPPPGCAFHPRCRQAQSICREIMPELSKHHRPRTAWPVTSRSKDESFSPLDDTSFNHMRGGFCMVNTLSGGKIFWEDLIGFSRVKVRRDAWKNMVSSAALSMSGRLRCTQTA